MYKVVLADDQYPLLDYLTASIPWETLGLELAASCSDGEEALEACRSCHPNILITDIGMPFLNGLELIEEARLINPQLRTIILSCHEDFHYAQTAVKLNVSEYILKESLRIEQLTQLLASMTAQLKEEALAKHDFRKLQDVVKQNRSALKSAFLRDLLEQPVWNEAEWSEKAETIGIQLRDCISYLPVAAFPERVADLEYRFGGAHFIPFILDNTLSESIHREGSIVLVLDERNAIILFPFHQTLKRNVHDEIRNELLYAQSQLKSVIRIGLSLYIGEPCTGLLALKKQILSLLEDKTFRFYAGEHLIVKSTTFAATQDDLFVHYSDALQDFRSCIQSEDEQAVEATVAKWISWIEQHRYPVHAVHSWVVNLMTELELKYTVMHHFVTNFNAELLHRTIYSMDTFIHLREWILQFIQEKRKSVQMMRTQEIRKEIADAKRYVMLHLDEKIGMEEMATRFNLNPSHFSRLFKKETGETFVEFVTRSKMERAQELLDKSDLNVDQIAEQLGFEHTSYFIKLFRAHTSMSPSEYRRSM